MKYVAFDLGASSGKLYAGTLVGNSLSMQMIHSFPNSIVPLQGGLYWDFLGIVRELCTGLRKAETLGHVDALGVDGFNNDFSLIDERGSLLMPVRAYRDPRTIRHWNAILDKVGRRKLYMLSGNQIAPFNTLMHLAAMNLDGHQYMLENAYRLLMLPDLIGYYITNHDAIEYTLAAETELLDLRNGQWIDELYQTFSIPKRLMPELHMPGTILGSSSTSFNTECGIRGLQFVNVCEHDTASAFIGSPLGKDAVLISSGTWALVGVETPAPVINDLTFDANIANEGGPKGHHRLLRNIMGLWLIQELKRNYEMDGHAFSFSQISEMAASAEAFRFPIDPDDAEFYLPGDMRKKICNVSMRVNGTAPETEAEFFRCAYEALAMKFRWAIELLEKAVQQRYEIINVIGGGCQDALLNQFTANACGRKVAAGPIEAAAIGNVLMQMIALGDLDSIEQGRDIVLHSFPQVTYHPQEWNAWDLNYERYAACFSSSLYE